MRKYNQRCKTKRRHDVMVMRQYPMTSTTSLSLSSMCCHYINNFFTPIRIDVGKIKRLAFWQNEKPEGNLCWLLTLPPVRSTQTRILWSAHEENPQSELRSNVLGKASEYRKQSNTNIIIWIFKCGKPETCSFSTKKLLFFACYICF